MAEKMMVIKVPQQWFAGLESTRGTLIEEIIQLGVQQLKFRRALEHYRSGAGSLGYVAEYMELSKRELICEARARGIIPLFDEQMVMEELGQ